MSNVSHGEMDAADIAALFDRNRLRIARELRGYSQVQLAREVGSVTSGSLSQFENGHTRPAAATLRRIAVALRVPLGFFAAPARPNHPQDINGFFRSLRSTAPRDRQQALAYVQLAREVTLELEKYVTLPELHLPHASQTVVATTPQAEIEALADDVRRRWNMPHGPVNDVVRTLERHGIVTTRFRVGLAQVDAFCVSFPDRPVVVLGADKGLRDRSRFDAAHELGHLVMHQPDQIGDKIIESQANQFAAAFLLPAAEIKNELPTYVDWPTFINLKARWHVSIAVLVMRARTLNVMDERTYSQAWKSLSARGWRKSEPGDIGPPENPVLLRRAVDLAADYGVTLNEIVRCAALPENEVRAILGDNDARRPRVEI